MRSFDRRQFLGSAAGVAAGWAATGAVAGREVAVPPPPDVVRLGATGIELTRVGQGTGVRGGDRNSDQTRMGFQKLVDLFCHCYDRGIRFFDLADLYGTHVYFREALRQFERDQVVILTKMWWRYDGPENETHVPHRKQAARTNLQRFMHELNTDYIDIVLLHCLMTADWDQKFGPYMEALAEAKEKGEVKAVGVSCHDFGALKTAATAPWVDVILARFNPKGVKMDAGSDEVAATLRTARQNGKAVLGMKILGEGQLADERDACIQFAQQSQLLDAMTIGLHTPEQVDDILRLVAKYPAAPLLA
jgi:aryl-alcohol dehydrogenase-like predicted oxidoreductase